MRARLIVAFIVVALLAALASAWVANLILPFYPSLGALIRPAWISGFEHRTDTARLGARDPLAAPSARQAAIAAGLDRHDRVDVAELHVPFSHQEILLRQALGLGENVDINPSGGALCASFFSM